MCVLDVSVHARFPSPAKDHAGKRIDVLEHLIKHSQHQGAQDMNEDHPAEAEAEADAPAQMPMPPPIRVEDRKRHSGRLRASPRRVTDTAFDDTLIYAYPAHLRETVQDLPRAPGVYTFHGEEGDLPLYIGKSINIRNRVLSHLRTPQEARMLRQTKRISHRRTAGEVGALLLEAQLIKTQNPLHNQKLRRSKQLVAWRVVKGQPVLVNAKDVNFAREPGLFGLYASARAAQQHLRSIADEQRLCYGVLGLEKLLTGRPCFRAQLKQCAGACCGKEGREAHHERFLSALLDLQVITWPYPGAVALVERSEDLELEDFHVVRNWCYLGTVHSEAEARTLDAVMASFDADSYKILCRPLMTGSVQVIPLNLDC